MNKNPHNKAKDDNSDETIAIKKELHRVVTMAYEGGVANAKWVIDFYKEEKIHLASTEANFKALLEDLLAEQMAFRNAGINPFKGLKDDFDLACLALKFERAFLTTSSPAVALSWLKRADLLDEKVHLLVEGICQCLIRRELVRILQLGYRGWQIEEGEVSLDPSFTTRQELPLAGTRKEEAIQQALGLARSAQALETGEVLKSLVPNIEPDKGPEVKMTKREKLKTTLNGFPWVMEPRQLSINHIHSYLLDQGMIEPSLPASEISALFTSKGPREPIRFLKTPGKLVVFFRLLAIEVLSSTNKAPLLEDFSREGLVSSSSWLYPRLVGTFRDKNGDQFTSEQLSASASRWNEEKLRTLSWFTEMEKQLEEAIRKSIN